jgi:hypothetical protein
MLFLCYSLFLVVEVLVKGDVILVAVVVVVVVVGSDDSLFHIGRVMKGIVE